MTAQGARNFTIRKKRRFTKMIIYLVTKSKQEKHLFQIFIVNGSMKNERKRAFYGNALNDLVAQMNIRNLSL